MKNRKNDYVNAFCVSLLIFAAAAIAVGYIVVNTVRF